VCVCARTCTYVYACCANVYIINTELLGGNFKVHVLIPHHHVHGFQRHACSYDIYFNRVVIVPSPCTATLSVLVVCTRPQQ